MIICFIGACLTTSSEFLDFFFKVNIEKSNFLENEAQGIEKIVLCIAIIISIFLWSYGIIIGK